MADLHAEIAFAKTYLNTLGRQPLVFSDDYQQAPQNSLKKVPVLPIAVPPVPQRRSIEAGPSSEAAPISITFKSLKPALTVTHLVSPTDTILSIKTLLHASHPDDLPPADSQRLLLKGKALTDQKLLKEYNVKDGDTVTLMFKALPKPQETPIAAPQPIPASSSDDITMSSPAASSNPFGGLSGSLDPDAKSGGASGRKHQRIPSVVLSPSPSNENPSSPGEKPKEILLDLDDVDRAAQLSPVLRDELTISSTYHDTLSKPEFWSGLVTFLKSQFHTESDVHLAFEDFLRASKSSLTVSDIAKIRDHTGIIGMAGK